MSAADARKWTAALAVAGALVLVAVATFTPPTERAGLFARCAGWVAALFVLGALLASPLMRWMRKPATHLRRGLGLMGAAFGVVHGGFAFFVRSGGEVAALSTSAQLRAGLSALAILALLALTSFPELNKALRVRAWTALHRLVYVAAALIALHAILSPFASMRWALGYGVLVGVALLLRLLPRRAARGDGAQEPAAPEPGSTRGS